MTNIDQYQAGHKHFCRLKKPTLESTHSIAYLDLAPVLECTNSLVVDNIIKATEKLNEKDVDIGLLELGRIFENVLEEYLNLAKHRSIFPVINKDLARLASMVRCIEVNKDSIPIKIKPFHLSLLKEERNLRAHGKIPTPEKRLEILAKAPFIVEMFIDYITKFSREIENVKQAEFA